MATKRTQGRQRIEIKKLEKKSSKQVTFSKRRGGLFKKAGELSLLCGAEVAIIIFSPSDKLFCFGHPSVDALLDRFLTGSRSPPKAPESCVPVAEFNRRHAEAVGRLEREKKNAAEAGEAAGNGGCLWWDLPMEGMELEELKEFRAALMEVRRKAAERIEGMVAMKVGGSWMPALPAPPAVHDAESHLWW